MNFQIIFVFFLFLFNFSQNSGFFEIKINFFPISLRICLKEFQSRDSQVCTFGQKSQQLLSRDSTLRIPFEFRWTESFSLILELKEKNQKFLISEQKVLPNSSWIRRQLSSEIQIQYRIQCQQNYHRNDCATFCRPRDDTFGHYFCDNFGKKVCIKGWFAENCEKPKCRKGCNEQHGYCELPDECTCRNGWKGDNCDQCQEYPGCLHGYCLSPFQCICHRNWGGILCDQDLNYCGTHHPCLNQGQCENIAPDHYRCICKQGFEGINCQTIVDSCATQPCLHSGTCITRANGTDFECECAQGFQGKRCENDVNECLLNPCLNGGTCHDLLNDFKCQCPLAFKGQRCEEDVDECLLLKPCVHSIQCINNFGDFHCRCQRGFEGKQCETEINECERNDVKCGNGGKCLDLVDDFRCVCLNQFSGKFCEELNQNICSEEEDKSALFWRLESKNSSKLCLCSQNTLKCSEKLNYKNRKCPHNQPEVKILFSNHVTDVCSTLLTISSMIEESRDSVFCCSELSSTSVSFYSNHLNEIRNYVTSGVWPELLQIVSTNDVKNTSEKNFLIIFILFFSFLLFISIFFLIYYKKRVQRRSRAQQIVIIQNNLRNESNSHEKHIF